MCSKTSLLDDFLSVNFSKVAAKEFSELANTSANYNATSVQRWAFLGSLDFFLLSPLILLFFAPLWSRSLLLCVVCYWMNEKNSVKKTFENNAFGKRMKNKKTFKFISLSENVICCLYWWDFNSVDIIFPVCASFCRTN